MFSRPGGGTRVGERLTALPLTLRSDPAAAQLQLRAVRDRPRLRAPTQSVFDNGLPLGPTQWISDGVLTVTGPDPALGRR